MQFYNGHTFDSHFLKCATVKSATSDVRPGHQIWRVFNEIDYAKL